MPEALKGWVMVTITLVFVLLYVSALVGWIRPLSDVTVLTRLEPLIFAIVGYYFGRLPAQENERTLKDEISRQTIKSDAAQQAKEQAQKEREVIEEKIKNALLTLTSSRRSISGSTRGSGSDKEIVDADRVPPNGATNGVSFVETAVRILDS